MPHGEYSNLVFSITLGLYPKSSHVKYSYLPKRFLDDNAEILAVSLPKSDCTWFDLILSSRTFNLIDYCHFYKGIKRFFQNLKGLLTGNVVSIVKKEYGSFVHSL